MNKRIGFARLVFAKTMDNGPRSVLSLTECTVFGLYPLLIFQYNTNWNVHIFWMHACVLNISLYRWPLWQTVGEGGLIKASIGNEDPFSLVYPYPHRLPWRLHEWKTSYICMYFAPGALIWAIHLTNHFRTRRDGGGVVVVAMQTVSIMSNCTGI